MSAPDPNAGSKRFLHDRNAYPETLSPEDFATYSTMKAAEDVIECARRLDRGLRLARGSAKGLAKAHHTLSMRYVARKERVHRMLADNPWRSRAEICREVGISRSTFYKMAHQLEDEGKIPRLGTNPTREQ